MKTFRDHPKRASILDAMDKFAWDYRKIATNRRARMRRKLLLTITSIGMGLAIFALAKELFKS